MGRRSCPTSLGARGRGQAQASSAAVCAAKAGGSQEGPDGSRAGVRGAGREVRTRGSSGRASVLGPERSPRTPRRHSPRVLHVDALVGGAGGRRLGEGGRAEDALRPGVHGGLEEPGERDARSAGDELRPQAGPSERLQQERPFGEETPHQWARPPPWGSGTWAGLSTRAAGLGAEGLALCQREGLCPPGPGTQRGVSPRNKR